MSKINTNYIYEAIKNLFDFKQTPAPQIPGMLTAIACTQKPGLSSIKSLSNVVSELNKHNIPTDPLPDGTENKTLILSRAIIKEVYRAMTEDASVQVAYAPGAITIMAAGANGGGPVICQGININFPQGQAIIQ